MNVFDEILGAIDVLVSKKIKNISKILKNIVMNIGSIKKKFINGENHN